MKKFAIALLAAVFFMAACTAHQSDDARKTYTFGMVLMTLTTEYWKLEMAGARDAAKKLGVEVKFLGPPEETQYEQQVKMVEDQITAGADAIILAASQPDTMIPVLNYAHQRDIPVVLTEAEVDFNEKVTFVGTRNYNAGKLGGEFFKDIVKSGDKVAIVRGQSGSKVHDERTKGFQDALKGKRIEFIVQDAQSDRVKAVNVMENILTANPDVKAVFATSDEMALGAHKALKNKKKNEIPLMGFDGTPDGLKAVQDGRMLANIAQNPYQIGYKAVEAAYKAKKGETVEKRIDSGAAVITKENVDQEIEKANNRLNQ
ncbi:sugar ABC transporter substrate-binding protein [Bacillus xiapuensis]|uniref:sugar ABC transporter substrate-binding protein n=1 Tax=Bacillus xiapuensis TaxID=2014075 RepID=UPI0012FE5D71|nr:sugar ABC transporter substrate-binding protein [Bacillus xiapuensis]